MSDGGKAESSRVVKDGTGDRSGLQGAGPNEFGRAISRAAVAQICQNVGFEGINESAVESLADIAVRYICDLGKTSSSYANSAGRTDCNVFDIIQGMEDLGVLRGFPGASDTGHCVASSGVAREMMDYLESAQEVPFGHSIPHFPVVRAKKPIPSFSQMGEVPEHKHIPDWLPAFPDRHTYVSSAVWNERKTDPRADKIALAKQRRQAERSLLSLQQRLVSNGAATDSTSMEPHGTRVGTDGSANPFLSKPLQAGEKEVSSVALPDKFAKESAMENNVSLMETFAPVVDAMRDGPSESETLGESMDILPKEKRSAVCLEFKTRKRVLGDSLDLRLRNRVSGQPSQWFGQNEEKDEKKRRAEFILRQSTEQHDLTQL